MVEFPLSPCFAKMLLVSGQCLQGARAVQGPSFEKTHHVLLCFWFASLLSQREWSISIDTDSLRHFINLLGWRVGGAYLCKVTAASRADVPRKNQPGSAYSTRSGAVLFFNVPSLMQCCFLAAPEEWSKSTMRIIVITLCCASLGAGEYECSQEALTVAAMTQIQNIFITPSGKRKTAVSAHCCLCCIQPFPEKYFMRVLRGHLSSTPP